MKSDRVESIRDMSGLQDSEHTSAVSTRHTSRSPDPSNNLMKRQRYLYHFGPVPSFQRVECFVLITATAPNFRHSVSSDPLSTASERSKVKYAAR
jgi:hypothetical protein